MSFPVLLRVFRTLRDAKRAQEILKIGGFKSDIREDKFEELTLAELNIPSRFRLYVDNNDYFKVAEYLQRKKNPRRIK